MVLKSLGIFVSPTDAVSHSEEFASFHLTIHPITVTSWLIIWVCFLGEYKCINSTTTKACLSDTAGKWQLHHNLETSGNSICVIVWPMGKTLVLLLLQQFRDTGQGTEWTPGNRYHQQFSEHQTQNQQQHQLGRSLLPGCKGWPDKPLTPDHLWTEPAG